MTLIGHSYGAIVVGLAAPQLPEVHDLVALGAPGMGAGRAADLGGARVWAALAAGRLDPADPAGAVVRPGARAGGRQPDFGARRLPTAGVAGHDFYLAPGSTTLARWRRSCWGRS